MRDIAPCPTFLIGRGRRTVSSNLRHGIGGIFGKAIRTVRSFAQLDYRDWILVVAILTYSIVFSEYSIAKFVSFRTGYFDFGNAVQLVWLAEHGHVTAYVLARPIMLLMAGFALIFPVPQTLLVAESVSLAIGAIPIYLISNRVLEDRSYALSVSLVYLVFPALTGINQYEFHDLTLCVPLLLFLFLFYLQRKLILFCVAGILALTTDEFIVIILGFFFLMIVWDYFESGRTKELKYFGLATFLMALCWALYLQSVSYIPAYSLATTGTALYTFTGSSSFLNVPGALENLPYSFGYSISAKITYLLLLFGPLLFTPILSLRRLIPALPWLGVIILYSPILGAGGTGPVYTVWSQWSAFVLPFVLIAGIYGIRELRDFAETWHRRRRVIRRVLAVIVCLTLTTVLVFGAFSPFQPQAQLSQGDNLVPVDIPSGQPYHGVWPTPVPNASLLDWFILQIPQEDSVLTQNQLGSKLAEREAPIYIFDQPGATLQTPAAILVDSQLPGYCPTCLAQTLAAANYSLAASVPAAGVSLYFLTS